MEQESKKQPTTPQHQRTSAPKELNVWEYVRLLNNTCKNFTFAERERIATMLKMHDRRAESLFAYFAEKSITQEMFIEGINQLLLNKNLVQKKATTPVNNKSNESQKTSRILDASATTAIPLIQIDLGFGAQSAQKKPTNLEVDTKKNATIEKLLKRSEPGSGVETSSNKSELPTPGKVSELAESRSASNVKDSKRKPKPTSNPFETSHLQKSQTKASGSVSTKKASRSSEKQAKENPPRNGSVGTMKLSTTNAQKPTVSTTFQVDRLLNKLTSPRLEYDTRANMSTSNISKDQSSRMKESGIDMRIERLLYGENYVNEPSSTKSSWVNCNQNSVPGKTGNSSNRIKVSELLNASPSAENQMKLLTRAAPDFPHYTDNSAMSNIPVQNKPEGSGFYQKVVQNMENALISLGAKQQQQQLPHNRFPSANPDKRSREDLTLPTKGPESVSEPIHNPIADPGLVFKSIEGKQQPLLNHLSPSSTRKFTNPVPHAYRLHTDTDERPHADNDRADVVTVEYEDDDEYNYRPSSVSQRELNNSRNRNEELAGSFGLKSYYTMQDQGYRNNLAKNCEQRPTYNKNENTSQICASGYEENGYPATQPTLNCTKETQETLESAHRTNISEFKNSLFRCYESEQVVPEEPSCMEKSNPTTFRKVESIAPLPGAGTSSFDSITQPTYQHSETSVEEKKHNDLFGFNPNNLSEKTRSILSSIINNINLEKNLPNLSKHLKKHSISHSKQTINTEQSASVREWATEASINNEVIFRQPCSVNQILSPTASMKQTQEEELDTSRNPVLYDDSESYSVYMSQTRRDENGKKELVNLVNTVESARTYEDEDTYFYQAPAQNQAKQNDAQYEQSETENDQANGFCMQNEFNIANQVETPEYGYKFQSRTGKEETNGKAKEEASGKGNARGPLGKVDGSNPILASFGGVREQLYDRFSTINSQVGASLQSPDMFDSKMMQSLTELLPSKETASSMKFDNYKFSDKKTEGSLTNADSQYFREQEEESKAFPLQRESLMSRSTNCGGEKASSQPLKDSQLIPERTSAVSDRLSSSSYRVENKMITIHALKQFCEQNQIYAENLVDEIFRYLNEHLVNKNYFLQILNNYLNCFPPMSQAIHHQDIASKMFEISDRNNDGIISINDLGDGCLLFCQKTPASNPDVGLLYHLLDSESKGFILESDIAKLLTKCQSLETEGHHERRGSLESPRQEAARIFRELDKERRGVLSYWDIYMWKDTFDFAQIVQRVNQSQRTSGTFSSAHQQNDQQEIRGVPAFVTVRQTERAFEDGGYIESGPTLENRTQEEEFQDKYYIQEHIYHQDQEDFNQRNDLIEEEEDDEARSPRHERRSWQRTRYTLSTIYENSLSRVEAEDHSFIRNNTQPQGQSDADELSSEARSIGYSANKENWGILEPDMLQRSARKEELYPDSDSKNGSRGKNFGSASKTCDMNKDSDLVHVGSGSTPSKSRRILTTVDVNEFQQHQTSIKKYGLKLEF